MEPIPTPEHQDPRPMPKFAAGLVLRGKYGYTTYRGLKRILDIILSSFLIVIFAPLMVIIALMIIVADGFPVIYKSKRIGEGGKEIYMFKFRSMVRNAEQILRDNPELMREFQQTFKLENDPRILPFGKFIRKTSIDELPQFFNVFLGNMSIVGPRPILPKEYELHGDQLTTYLQMKPGCAGLWQCSGRSETTYEERIELDEQYFRSASIRNDLKILVMTFLSILKREGAK